jgi:hypothetical protein
LRPPPRLPLWVQQIQQRPPQSRPTAARLPLMLLLQAVFRSKISTGATSRRKHRRPQADARSAQYLMRGGSTT